MKAFLVSWYASGYCGTFRYMVVANNLDEAKEIWNKFVEGNKDVEYSWRKAEKGVRNHYGGYITWEEKGNSDKEKNLTEKDLAEIFSKYLHIVTNEELTVEYQSVENGG